jgi:UPF0755 protein
MRKRILVASIIVIICSLVLGSLYLYFMNLSTTNSGDNYIIIKKNATLEQVAKQLQEKNIIKSQDVFIYYAKTKGSKGSVKGGNFVIKPRTKLNDLIIRLKDGKSEFTVITIPEGYTLYQIASKLEENKLVKKEDMLKEKLNILKANTMILSKKDVLYDLEGYLFPDTYYIPNDAKKGEVINIMVDRFKSVFTDKYKARAKELALDVNEVITIASLIEREAANESERSRIAGVIYNRLKIGMPLQVDAAVIYANTKGEKNIDKVYYNTLKIESKYNTYLYKGLPPGPIASPGKASIEATLYPEKNDYLYYVANGKGHVFSKTYGEHLTNVKKYIK